MYQKGTFGVFFSMSFSNSLNMKKMLSFSFVGFVKKLNDIGLVIMTKPSYSFLGTIKLTMMGPSEGWTYITSICYPCKACVKIPGVLARNCGGKLEVFD